jgi:hypothetical protein
MPLLLHAAYSFAPLEKSTPSSRWLTSAPVARGPRASGTPPPAPTGEGAPWWLVTDATPAVCPPRRRQRVRRARKRSVAGVLLKCAHAHAARSCRLLKRRGATHPDGCAAAGAGRHGRHACGATTAAASACAARAEGHDRLRPRPSWSASAFAASAFAAFAARRIAHARSARRRRASAASRCCPHSGAVGVWHAQARGCVRPTSEPREKICQNDGKQVQSLLSVCSSFWQGVTAPEGADVRGLPLRQVASGEVTTLCLQRARRRSRRRRTGWRWRFTGLFYICAKLVSDSSRARRRCCLPVGRVRGEIRAAVARIPRAAADVFAICDAGGRAEVRVAPKASVGARRRGARRRVHVGERTPCAHDRDRPSLATEIMNIGRCIAVPVCK